MNIGASEILVIVAIGALLFGPQRLPKFARSLGEAVRGFKKEISQMDQDKKDKNQEPS